MFEIHKALACIITWLDPAAFFTQNPPKRYISNTESPDVFMKYRGIKADCKFCWNQEMEIILWVGQSCL